MMVGHASAVNRAKMLNKLEREVEALQKSASEEQQEEIVREMDRMKSIGGGAQHELRRRGLARKGGRPLTTVN
jgi:hypothetical protein